MSESIESMEAKTNAKLRELLFNGDEFWFYDKLQELLDEDAGESIDARVVHIQDAMDHAYEMLERHVSYDHLTTSHLQELGRKLAALTGQYVLLANRVMSRLYETGPISQHCDPRCDDIAVQQFLPPMWTPAAWTPMRK